MVALLLAIVLVGACAADQQPTATPALAAPETAAAVAPDEFEQGSAPAEPRPGTETSLPDATDRGTGTAPVEGSPAGPGGPSPVASAPSSSPGVTPPPGSAKGLTKEVFAFLNHYSLDAVEGRIEYDVLSHIGFFSIGVDRDGRLVKGTRGRPDPAWKAWTGSQMARIIEDAHANGTKVILTAERFAWTPRGRADTVRLLSSAAARKRMAKELAAAVEERGVDGVNVDLEPVPNGQKARFTLLMKEMRAALDAVRPGLELTFASIGFTDEYDLKALLAPGVADALFIMAYQYRGNWSEYAGSVAPMRTENFGIEQTLEAFLQDTTPDKVILGVPYYGWQWRTTSNRPNARTLPANARNGRSRPVFYEEAADLAERHGSTYDPKEVTARVVYRARDCGKCPLLWRQAYFDDRQSLARKYEIVKERGLRGAGIWALGFDGSRSGELYELLRDAFRAP